MSGKKKTVPKEKAEKIPTMKAAPAPKKNAKKQGGGSGGYPGLSHYSGQHYAGGGYDCDGRESEDGAE